MASEIETLKDTIIESEELLSDLESELDDAVESFLAAGKALRAARKRITALQKKLQRATESAESIEELLDEKSDRIETLEEDLAEQLQDEPSNKAALPHVVNGPYQRANADRALAETPAVTGAST